MANVIKKTPNSKGVYEYRKSVNTPDYPTADWLIDPDVSALSAIPRRHWKVSGSSVVEMSSAEKTVVDTPPAPVGQKLYLSSPDASVWEITVNNGGALGATKQ